MNTERTAESLEPAVQTRAAAVRILGGLLLASSLTSAPAVNAAVYYIDAAVGNDSWAGTASAPVGSPATNGPWRTLGRANQHALLPNDYVLLRCGQRWHETLAPVSSGSATQPIVFGSFPAGCTTPPVIDGSFEIPPTSWSLDRGAVYKVKFPLEILLNGTFSAGVAGWRSWSPAMNAQMSAVSTCAAGQSHCLRFTGGTGPNFSLLTSARFGLQSGISYTVSGTYFAPAGTTGYVAVRRDTSPWDVVGPKTPLPGRGTWQSFSVTVTPSSDFPLARLDFEVPPGQTIDFDTISVKATLSAPFDVYFANGAAVQARHPNPLPDTFAANSGYFRIAANAATVANSSGKPGSNSFDTGADLSLPSGAALAAGIGVTFRTNSWLIDEMAIASVSGTRLNMTAATTFPLVAGWGYYFTGALWMLDEPGEWYYDNATSTLYVWMPDSAAPGSRVAVGRLQKGVNASSRSNLLIGGISVEMTHTGVDLFRANNVTVRNAAITDSLTDAIDARSSINVTVENMKIRRSGRNAIDGADFNYSSQATGLRALNNEIVDSGVRFENGRILSNPVRSKAAIVSGMNSTITGNTVLNSGYIGIWPGVNSTVESNRIEDSCLVLDDCAGIYVHGPDMNTLIRNNFVNRSRGNVAGKGPGYEYTQAQGIYLDGGTSKVTVSDNVVMNADHGIQVHSANTNDVVDNRLYLNRKYQVWLQETSASVRTTGDVFSNRVLRNHMVPNDAVPAILLQSVITGTDKFGTIDSNRYSGLTTSLVGATSGATTFRSYNLQEWRAITGAGGVPLSLDAAGTQVTLGAVTPYRVSGASVLPAVNDPATFVDWRSWNQTLPLSEPALIPCFAGQCLRYVAGAPYGLINSKNFSVVRGTWYRVSFDLLASVAGQIVNVGVRRGGGGTNSYEWLMPSALNFNASTSWKRFTFTFQATKTVNADDPVTGDHGARIDFRINEPGRTVTIANVEMVPLTPAGASLRSAVISNPTRTNLLVPCPDANTAPVFCSGYVRFSDGGAVNWPYLLQPLKAEAIYSRGDTLTDADSDGIADVQDRCPASPAGGAVDSRGCGFGQTPQ